MPRKNHPNYVEYANGYSPGNLPQLSRHERYDASDYFTGVRSCGERDRADSAAKKKLKEFKEEVFRNNADRAVVRWGWYGASHYWETKGGGFGSSGRSCHGFVEAKFYVDFARLSFADDKAMPHLIEEEEELDCRMTEEELELDRKLQLNDEES